MMVPSDGAPKRRSGRSGISELAGAGNIHKTQTRSRERTEKVV